MPRLTSIHSYEAFLLLYISLHIESIFSESSGTHLLFKCSRPSSPAGFALCFCKLKETVFLSWGSFWVSKHKRNLIFFDSILFFYCKLWYRSMNNPVWLNGPALWEHNEVSITLPALLFAAVCLPFSICEIDKNIIQKTVWCILVLQVVFTRWEMYTDLIVYFYYRSIISYSERRLGLNVILLQCKLNVAYSI